MKIQVLFTTDGQPGVVAGEVEADDWTEMKINLPALLRSIADELATAPDDLADDWPETKPERGTLNP